MTISDLVSQVAGSLAAGGIEGAPREARLLVAHVTGISVSRLTLEMGEAASSAHQEKLLPLVARRIAREPLSHLLGKRAFYEHEFKVTADTLDPRPETETLVAEALKEPFVRVLDLGTGTGAIAISLLAARPAARGVATDLSGAALAVAQENAAAIGVADRLEFVQSDWFSAVSGQFDLIVSNPPYIAAEEMAGLAPELAHEPRMALTDEGDGLAAYRVITANAKAYLAPEGRLLVEIGHRQGADVAALFADAGFGNVGILNDLDGRNRVVSGQNRP
ncbi:peptide chain release factor N(5)-glutamine methyltransferase [Shimia haliotis]|uniref:peptide chain release factor N(5)-glutamine methyltransferase n=1 Tax=Shimia haliotis TaxID=1280847 RepID=UPI000B86CA01|nr:peptide chain release factor N(5)-glutamine methyltransferase [Shimia haliotis]